MENLPGALKEVFSSLAEELRLKGISLGRSGVKVESILLKECNSFDIIQGTATKPWQIGNLSVKKKTL